MPRLSAKVPPLVQPYLPLTVLLTFRERGPCETFLHLSINLRQNSTDPGVIAVTDEAGDGRRVTVGIQTLAAN